MNMRTVPKDSMVKIDHSYYKIGVRGLPFIWSGEEWIRSNKEKHEILKAINQQKNKPIYGDGSMDGAV